MPPQTPSEKPAEPQEKLSENRSTPKPRKEDQNPYRMLHIGMEFAGATLVLALIGWLADAELDTEPYGALIGGSIGFIGGLYLFIKEAVQANQSHDKRHAKDQRKHKTFSDRY